MAEWFKSYRFRYKFTIDADEIVSDLTDEPVRLTIDSSAGTGTADLTKIFDIVGARWINLAVCGADGETPLAVQVHSWDEDTEVGELDILVPKISSSLDTDLYLYFDPDGIGNGYMSSTVASASDYDAKGAYAALEVITEAAAGAWLSDWQSRQKISVASGNILSSGADVVTAFVFDGTSGASLFSVLGENSDKIAITDHTGVRQCFVDVKSWSGAGTAAELHVTVPLIDPDTDLVLYLYFDANKADNDGFVGTTAATVSATTFSAAALETYAGIGWLRGFTKRTKVLVAATNIDASLDYFPLTLFISSSCGTATQDMTPIFDEIGANHKKIAVTAADGKTQLPVEIDYWDDTGETAVLHVRVPSLDSEASTALYLYYSADVPDNDEFVGDTAEAPAMLVWDEDHRIVLHLTDSSLLDSTVLGNDGINGGTSEIAGMVGQARDFELSTTDYISFTDIEDINGKSFTASLLYKAESLSAAARLCQKRGTGAFGSYAGWQLSYNVSPLNWRNTGVDDGAGHSVLLSANDGLATGAWHQASLVFDTTTGNLKLYIDGVQSDSATDSDLIGANLSNARQLTLGCADDAGSKSQYWDGVLDEFRFSDIARSAAWIKATYYSSDDNLVTYTTDIESEDNWLGDWANRIQIRIDSTKIDADLADFPVAIHLGSAAGINGVDLTAIFDELGANNLKLAVATAAGAQCYVEIDTWDETAETAVLHTKIPTVYAGRDTIFYLYYDADKADNSSYVGVTGSASGQGVWDASFLAVYHMSQDPTGGAGCIKDSTASGLDATPAGTMTAEDLVAATCGKGADFDGNDDYYLVADCAALDTATSPATWEAIMLGDSDWTPAQHDYHGIVTKGYAWASGHPGLRIYERDTTGTTRLEFGSTTTVVANSFANGTAKHIAGVAHSAANDQIFIDGVEVASYDDQAQTVFAANSYGLRIGDIYPNSGDYLNYNGIIDEVRISTTDRSAAWLKATYYTLFDSLAIFGVTETLGGSWLSGWQYRRAFTVPATNIDADLSDFPVALFLNTAAGTSDVDTSSIFDALGENAKRIAVTAAHGDKQVPVEIDMWDGAGENAVLHAKAPLVTAADGAVLYVYYDDDRPDNGFVGDTGDAIAQRVWDDDFVAVLHMSQQLSGAAGQALESTAGGFNFTSNNHDGDELAASVIGKAPVHNGTDEYLSLDYDAGFDNEQFSSITWEGVVDYTLGEVKQILANAYSNNNFVALYVTSAGKIIFRLYCYSSPNYQWTWQTDAAISNGAHHIAVEHTNGSNPVIYVDGASVAFTATLSNSSKIRLTSNTTNYIGRYYSGSDYTDGYVDEVRYSKATRSSAWLKATYYCLFDNLAAWGTEDEESTGEGGPIEEILGKAGRIEFDVKPILDQILLVDYLNKAGRIEFDVKSLTDEMTILEPLSKSGRIEFAISGSLTSQFIGNLLKMVDAAGSRPKITTATGTRPGISAAGGTRPRLAAAEAYEYQERE